MPETVPILQPELHRMSGGEIDGLLKESLVSLRQLITAEPDVFQLLDLTPLDEAQPDGRWLYFIEAPFATFPRYVIGETDVENKLPTVVFQSGAEWSAVDYWITLTRPIQ
ncbi:MAG: hypothetical protein EOP83_14785 [Verrucomicrobiaceae bacterium]|nr:MAG: hypothetical protein EOP83_14785 [Verrucomicrobiaceae bacterium]